MRRIVVFVLSILVLTACTSKLKKENEALEDEIAERREALSERMHSELDLARQELRRTDSLLAEVTREHDELHRWVMDHATRLNDHSPEVLRLNGLRASVDSLRVEFEKQGLKVKFYMEKIEERERDDDE